MNKKNTIAQSTLAIIIFSLIGKVMGFARETMQAAIFGATHEASAFVLAQGATSMISTLITTAIATTFIPVMQKVERELGDDHRLSYTNNLIWISLIITTFVTVLGIFFSPYIAKLTAAQARPETYKLVVQLVEVGMPVVIFSAIVGVFTGFLQYGGKFAAAGAIAIPLNLVYIIYLACFSKTFGVLGLTVASVIAVFVQIIFLMPSSFKIGFRPKFIVNFKDRYVREAVVLSLPVLVSTSVNDINVFVNRNLASGMSDSAPAILNVSNKMNTLILGIFITAVTAIIFPILARSFSDGDVLKGKKVMNASIKSVLFLTIPATVGMFILARPIIDIAFVHGKFTPADGLEATSTLRCYSLALISISLSNVLNRVYYSLEDTKTPFYIGVINVAINVGLNLLVAHKFGTQGLAASVSIATTIAVLISFYLLHRKIGNLGTKSYIKAIIKTGLSSFLMGLVAFIYFPMENIVCRAFSSNAALTVTKLICLMIVVGLALIVYLVSMYLLGVREIRDITKIIKKKIKNKFAK